MAMKTTTTMMALLLFMVFASSTAEVFTSMVKLQQLAKFENAMLAWLMERGHTDSQDILQFLDSRMTMRNSYDHVTMHPNTVLLLAKAFLLNWQALFEGIQLMQKEVKMRAELPTEEDIKGCMSAIILLQSTYNISARQVYSGNFSGYLGPALSVVDAVRMGLHAFYMSELWCSSAWLEVAREETERSVQSQIPRGLAHLKEMLLSLLGRISNLKGDIKKAHALLREATELTTGGPSPQRQSLEKELSQPRQQKDYSHLFVDPRPPSFRQLCCRDRDHTVDKLRPFHICRYKPSFTVPYLLYKEEVLSYNPHVSLFHDVISDTEITALKALSTRLKRSYVTTTDSKNLVTRQRTGQFYWVHESESEVTARLMCRISDVTWLLVRHIVVNTTTHYTTNTTDPSTITTIDPNTINTSGFNTTNSRVAAGTSEKLQVLNYGLAGHYSYHYDDLTDENRTKAKNLRMATFMLYLSDPEIGGHTIFPKLNISIAPVKGMAVFWYNLTPGGDVDKSTIHSGCPVLKGNKWIANQWIQSHDNLFRRPCGLTPHCDQQHLELLMDSRRLHPLTPP